MFAGRRLETIGRTKNQRLVCSSTNRDQALQMAYDLHSNSLGTHPFLIQWRHGSHSPHAGKSRTAEAMYMVSTLTQSTALSWHLS